MYVTVIIISVFNFVLEEKYKHLPILGTIRG